MSIITGQQVDFLQTSIDLQVRPELRSGSMQPILLHNVQRADTGDTYPNAMICIRDTEIAFNIRSKGPCGFGFRIQTGAGPIVETLYRDDSNCSGQLIEAWAGDHYFNDKSNPKNGLAIKVDAIDLSIANTNPDLFRAMWECQIYTWPIYGFRTEDGSTFGNSRDGTRTADVLPGTLAAGSQTGITHGTISHINEPEKTYQSPEARYLAFWVFVFKSEDAVNDYVDRYGEPNVGGWG